MLLLSHAYIQDLVGAFDPETIQSGEDIYRQRTATPIHFRTLEQIESFFGGRALVEPGLVYLPLWRPDPAYPSACENDPPASAGIGAIAKIS
jgi:hypothetical protein